MHFLTGATSSREFVEVLKKKGWGRVYIERKPKPYEGEQWVFDNGAYSWFLKGELINEDIFLKRLDKAYTVGKPLFGIVPDIVASEKSFEYSLEWIEKLPKDWRWYLAVQDGMKKEDITPHLHKFDGIFLGGSDKFKAQAPIWCNYAHQHNKRFHYGRAGTPRKILHALDSKADSADSAFPLWTKERFYGFCDWWDKATTVGIERLFPIDQCLGL